MNRRRSREHWAGPRYRVDDKQAFARILRASIGRLYGGNVNEAARLVGLSQSTLHRMCTNPSAALYASSLRAVERLLSPDDRLAFGQTLLTPEAQERIAAQRRWIDATNAQQFALRRDLVRELIDRVKREVPDVVTEWQGLFRRPGFLKGRRAVALWRVVAPLAEAESAGGVERTHEELTVEEFQQFVRRGWEREKILLRREPDVVRAQELKRV
jgi:hypothetical protein